MPNYTQLLSQQWQWQWFHLSGPRVIRDQTQVLKWVKQIHVIPHVFFWKLISVTKYTRTNQRFLSFPNAGRGSVSQRAGQYILVMVLIHAFIQSMCIYQALSMDYMMGIQNTQVNKTVVLPSMSSQISEGEAMRINYKAAWRGQK